MTACAIEAEPPAPTTAAAEPVVEWRPAEPNELVPEADVVLDDDFAAAQNCVYIQWCDQPNSTNGTVCRVRSSCRSQCTPSVQPQIWAECTADANAVCGGVTPIARVFCD